jgi:hypothetical protein
MPRTLGEYSHAPVAGLPKVVESLQTREDAEVKPSGLACCRLFYGWAELVAGGRWCASMRYDRVCRWSAASH